MSARPSDSPSPASRKECSRRPVRSLPQEVARKIAAGEVIDRPNAIVRELLDNAVDSGADWIQVEIEGGGIDKIRVVDNGMGMTKEDLENCARPHATSKITAETDLLNLSTLGFRGEALSSIAAVSRLQITSATRETGSWQLTASVTQEHHITPASLNQGTVVQSEALFENFPARRTFLKRPAAETAQCRQTFVEKALPRTDISFRLLVDGKQRLDLPAGQSLAQRFTEALGLKESPSLFYEIHSHPESQKGQHGPSQQDWKFTVIIGEPAVARNDKKLIYVYVNGRKITEYSLVQAIDYGATGYFPNGTHPVAALFLEVNPALVDFNIHPAKREARFKDIAPIHRSVSQTVRQFFRNYSVSKLSAQAVGTIFDDDFTETHRPHPVGKPSANLFDQADGSPNLYDTPLHVSATKWWQQAREEHGNNAGRGKKSYPQYNSAGSIPVARRSFEGKPEVARRQDTRGQFFSDCYSKDYQSAESAVATPAPSYGDRQPGFGDGFTQSLSSAPPNPAPPDDTVAGASQGERPHPELSQKIRYLGTTQGVYLVVELEDSLYLIDQHAAHERLLYNSFIAQAGQKQNLLIPYVVETSSDADDEYLRSLQERLATAGFHMKECGQGRWECHSVPVQWKGTEADLERDLLGRRLNPEELVAALASTNACRQAVMDGTILDDDTACQLALNTLSLEDPHCPHGRPLWIRISREDMDRGVKRT